MRVGQVGDVDVVADAGAVGGGIVVAVDANGGASPERDVEDERNQVGFRVVGFAAGDALGTFRRAGYVEVAQRGIAQAVNAIEPAEHVLDKQLGLAIGIGRGRRASSLIGMVSGSP